MRRTERDLIEQILFNKEKIQELEKELAEFRQFSTNAHVMADRLERMTRDANEDCDIGIYLTIDEGFAVAEMLRDLSSRTNI